LDANASVIIVCKQLIPRNPSIARDR
jgi:hypothetical protein